ncbi:MAG: hypothetical protein B6247_25790 [Candidatus Parabeggiatoa sp. nov. 2]|nr:MAG: hypothetical protein B6247_25790 [Beggiatoa sp. 4572_84]
MIADGRADLRPDLARTRMNYANCLDSLGELEAARTASQHSLDEYQALIADGRAELRPELAGTRMNYALCLANLGELEAARTAYQHSLDEYQALIADGRADLRPGLALIRYNLANCLKHIGDPWMPSKWCKSLPTGIKTPSGLTVPTNRVPLT